MDLDSVKPAKKSNVGGLVRAFAKVLRFRASVIAPDSGKIRRLKSGKKLKDDEINGHHHHQSKVESMAVNGHQSKTFNDEDDKLKNREAMEAFLAKLFASISSVKASYSQLQIAQSPYHPDGIQAADEKVVSELKRLSELKQCYLKKQMDPSPQETQLLAEIQEQQSLLKTYGIVGKKLESQLKLKDSEITFLREKLQESEAQNRALEKRLGRNQSGSSGPLSVLLDDLHLSGLNPNHLITVLRFAGKSIRSFVKVMIDQMRSAGWDLDAAADSIEPGMVYTKPNHKCFAFECFGCREMFDGFHVPNFSLPNVFEPERDQRQRYFFARFTELKSVKPMEFLTQKPRSPFGKFCRAKYLRLIHTKMESAFFGDLDQRDLVNAGGYPETAFFANFAEMAKRVWLLHCLAFSFEPEASIFQVVRGYRFSEVYMESVADDALWSPVDVAEVGFTVVPGFRIGKTVIQCQVYLSPA